MMPSEPASAKPLSAAFSVCAVEHVGIHLGGGDGHCYSCCLVSGFTIRRESCHVCRRVPTGAHPPVSARSEEARDEHRERLLLLSRMPPAAVERGPHEVVSAAQQDHLGRPGAVLRG